MLLEKNVVGKKTDWANYITLADEHETPLLRILPKGPKPVNVVKHYQADTYTAPQPNAWPDGKDWTEFKTAGANRVELTARCQWFVQTAAVSKLAEDVTDTAGISDELAHEIPKKMTEMAREMECAAASDQVAYADDGQKGHTFRGMGYWLLAAAAAQSDADTAVASTIRPPTNSVSTAASTALTEIVVKTILESMWTQTGNTGNKVCVLGTSAKKMFTNFQFYSPADGTTVSAGRPMFRQESSTTLGNTVDRYNSDWGTLELHMTRWNQHPNFTGGSATYAPFRSYFINTSRWAWLWNQKPTVYKPEFKGGSYKAAIDAILMFLCWNPIGEGAWKPAS
jgi:hypothetical protein